MISAGAPHVTLHDVAAKAGVSISTVSRALNGLSVRKKSLAKVQAAADELGYVANEGARSLRGVRTHTMGVVFFDLNAMIGLELLEALTATVEDQGYSLFVSTARGSEERYDLLMRRFLERRVDALFCVRPSGEASALERFEKAGVPVVALFGRRDGYRRLPVVAPSILEAGGAVVRRLMDLGHERIALITPSRRVDYMRALEKLAISEGLKVRNIGPMNGAVGAISFLDSLRSEPDFPTAVIAGADDALQLLSACYEQNVPVPDALSIIAVGDQTSLGLGRTGLSTIHLNAAKIGRAAAMDMFERFEGREVPHERLLENGTWIDRGSVGPAPAKTRERSRR